MARRLLLWPTQIAEPELGCSRRTAPVDVNGKILIGTIGGQRGVRDFVKADDANDGKPPWTLCAVPERGHEGVWESGDAGCMTSVANTLSDSAVEYLAHCIAGL